MHFLKISALAVLLLLLSGNTYSMKPLNIAKQPLGVIWGLNDSFSIALMADNEKKPITPEQYRTAQYYYKTYRTIRNSPPQERKKENVTK